MNTDNDNAMNKGEGNDGDVDIVGDLLNGYIAEHRSQGAADPGKYLEKVEGRDREELVALIDAYLIRSPGRAWNPDAVPGSFAERIVEKFERLLDGESGTWPTLLPSLRNSAQIPRRTVVERLANALGVSGKEDKVGLYYNEMEHGTLPAAGVSDRVLEALAGVVGSTLETLRAAGNEIGGGSKGGVAPVFTRKVSADSASTGMASPAQPETQITGIGPESDKLRVPSKGSENEPDEVDRLFTGGS